MELRMTIVNIQIFSVYQQKSVSVITCCAMVLKIVPMDLMKTVDAKKNYAII
jgi:hypothetical protein